MLIEKISRPGKKAAGSADRLKAQTLDRDLLAGGAYERVPYKSYDDLPLFLNAKTVAKVLGVSPSSGYELLHDPGFPVMRVGNRMVVPKEQFIQWVSDHTGGGT